MELQRQPYAACCKIKRIAIEINSPLNFDTSRFVFFKSTIFHLVHKIDFNSFINDISRSRNLYLDVKIEDGVKHLWLCLIRFYKSNPEHSNQESNQHLISYASNHIKFDLAVIIKNNINHDEGQDEQQMESINEYSKRIYNLIKNYHEIYDELNSVNSASTLNSIIKLKLRPYQERAIEWLIKRENIPVSILSTDYIEIEYTNEEHHKIKYLNHKTLEICDQLPMKIGLPSGGILADEMGLGKTVEILSLVLLNQRKLNIENSIQQVVVSKPHNNQQPEDNNDTSSVPPPKKKKKSSPQPINLLCICTKTRKSDLIECKECHRMQHINCVAKYEYIDENYRSNYLCPECWILLHNQKNIETKSNTNELDEINLIESNATLIISPQTIAQQWYEEIMLCSVAPLKVIYYDGILKSGWKNPEILSKCDIVITHYNVLQKEIYYRFGKSHNLRSEKKYMRIKTPLLFIKWWRVCLDEAQMVENATANVSIMAKAIPAVHRWAVTGTPIHKCIDDLRGLLEFVQAYPFYQTKFWNNLKEMYKNNNIIPLQRVLGTMMWRSCKLDVIKELNIPPQTTIIHKIRMNDIERLFYNDVCRYCLVRFDEIVQKLSSRRSLINLDSKTIKEVLEPFRKLRQSCVIPVLHYKTNVNVKKVFLTPDELNKHLIDKSTNECKQSLRTMISSINGMAAMHMLTGAYQNAISCYENVLSFAKQYNGTVCVDSLLQIHALHNLISAKKAIQQQQSTPSPQQQQQKQNTIEPEDFTKYENECQDLEWKYLEAYYNNLKKVENNVNSCKEDVNQCERKLIELGDKDGSKWWKNIIELLDKCELFQKLLRTINYERPLFVYHNSLIGANTNTPHGLDLQLTVIANEIITKRKDIFEHLKVFDSLIANKKPFNQISKKIQNKIKNIIQLTFDCHLNEIRNNENSLRNREGKSTTSTSSEKAKCDLCKIKESLSKLECLIFRKTFDQNVQVARGDSNPSFFEVVLRLMCAFTKAKFPETEAVDINLKRGETYLQLLDAIKKEFKELEKYWIEIEYVVKAYDELDMCKMRLGVNDLAKSTDKNIYNITSQDIELTMSQNKMQFKSAEIDFHSRQSKLKYINHLTSEPDHGVCPICEQEEYLQYGVLECGHITCVQCLKEMSIHSRRNSIRCAVCRQITRVPDVLLVSKSLKDSQQTKIVGVYSTKIEEIIRSVIRLKEEDKNVKILIFSSWSKVLEVIGQALNANGIKYRMNATPQYIEEFKDPILNVTCFLLPLLQGSKGLNLTEATHVFLVEPILNPGEELQAVGRVHRIGQTKPTTVHRFIVNDTIEEVIQKTTVNDLKKINTKGHIDIDFIRNLFIFSSQNLNM